MALTRGRHYTLHSLHNAITLERSSAYVLVKGFLEGEKWGGCTKSSLKAWASACVPQISPKRRHIKARQQQLENLQPLHSFTFHCHRAQPAPLQLSCYLLPQPVPHHFVTRNSSEEGPTTLERSHICLSTAHALSDKHIFRTQS